MTAIKKFYNDLINWLARNGFSNCDVDFSEIFEYDRDSHTIYFATIEPKESGHFFQQYLYEYGCEKAPFIDVNTLAFLHEACHHLTLGQFDDIDIAMFSILKEFIDKISDYEHYSKYWDIADEFIANMEVVNFINDNFNAVIKLQEIITSNLKEIN